MTMLHQRVTRNNVFRWGERFLSSLEEAVSERGRYIDTLPQPLRMTEVRDAYLRASRRILILDHDGTLVPVAARSCCEEASTGSPAQSPARSVDRPRGRFAELPGLAFRQIDRELRSVVWFGSRTLASSRTWRGVEVSVGRHVGTLAVAGANGLEIHSYADLGALCGSYARQLFGRKEVCSGLALSHG